VASVKVKARKIQDNHLLDSSRPLRQTSVPGWRLSCGLIRPTRGRAISAAQFRVDYGRRRCHFRCCERARIYLKVCGRRLTCERNSPALDDSTTVSEPRPLALALKNQHVGVYYLQSSQRMVCIWQSVGQTLRKRPSFVAAASRYVPWQIQASLQNQSRRGRLHQTKKYRMDAP